MVEVPNPKPSAGPSRVSAKCQMVLCDGRGAQRRPQCAGRKNTGFYSHADVAAESIAALDGEG